MKHFLLFLLLVSIFSACGGRVPSPKTAQHVSASFLKSYGNKYKSSDLGGKNLDHLAINSIQELHRHVVEVDSFVTLKDGRALRTLLTLEKDFPRGWHVTSWEKIQ